jgi:hypothetical protein
MIHHIQLYLLLLLVVGATANCKKDSDFSAGEKTRGSEDSEGTPGDSDGDGIPDEKDSDNESDDSEEAACDEANGKTDATLLTDKIQSNAADQFVKYEVALTNCDGSPKNMTDESIYFDLNAIIDQFGEDVEYRILKPSDESEILAGTLVHKEGKDLFGQTGPQFGYWVTGQVTLKGATDKLLLVIDMSELGFRPPSDAPKDSIKADSFVVDSFLRFGEASPVTEPLTIMK